MWTGASIMQLVAQGKLDLHQPVAPIIDAQLAAMAKINFPGMESFNKMSDLWGAQVETVTLRELLAMQSGIPDFDTANPSRTGPDLDPFRATVYSEPGHDFLEPAKSIRAKSIGQILSESAAGQARHRHQDQKRSRT